MEEEVADDDSLELAADTFVVGLLCAGGGFGLDVLAVLKDDCLVLMRLSRLPDNNFLGSLVDVIGTLILPPEVLLFKLLGFSSSPTLLRELLLLESLLGELNLASFKAAATAGLFGGRRGFFCLDCKKETIVIDAM